MTSKTGRAAAARAWTNKYANYRALKEKSQHLLEGASSIQGPLSLRGAMETAPDGDACHNLATGAACSHHCDSSAAATARSCGQAQA